MDAWHYWGSGYGRDLAKAFKALRWSSQEEIKKALDDPMYKQKPKKRGWMI